MTSGDGERPEIPADTRAGDSAASAAELCLDSDELLTNRRGGQPPVRQQPGNGHVAGASAAELIFAGVETSTPSAPSVAVPSTAGTDGVDVAVAEGAVSSPATNGYARHAANTTEYPATEPVAVAEPLDPLMPAQSLIGVPAEELIEVPLPAADVAWAPVTIDPEEATAPLVETTGVSASLAMTEPITLADPDIPAIPPADPPAPPLAAAPPPPPAAPPPDEGEEEGATMTIIEHLEELRHRVTISAISVVVGAVIGWFIVPHVVQYLEIAAKKLGGKFFSPTILGPFGLEIKLAFLIGIIIASPVVLFQIWGFIAPGLTRHERRYALPFSLIGGALFAGGAVTGVLIVPLAIQFLTHFFQVLALEQLLDIDKYIMFIALIAMIFGITFELPIFMVGFSLLGVVNSRFFIQKFRIAIFIIYGVSMVITPGADLISPLVLGTFLIVLYWLGVLLIRVIGR